MSTGWLVLVALLAVGFGWSLTAVYRGAARAARTDTRQDLIKLGSVPQMAKSLTDLSSLPSYAFMAPFAEGRTHPFGWLWWRVKQDGDGTPSQQMGWALTYRGARKAAGLPRSIRAQHTEITLAPGHERQTANG
ncbi:hypothetical protein [Streptomyces noursei]|uniref:hypothetical protein n=1 Tax=Streptomyces noursei TaxID=1971 RepID=UPI001672B881|nr:hypothetical protein [Streptomyces noursei]MCZ1014409.1 hypothetical protein [Streptomyces noursei]GGW94803.1 hypothetical protein GCM10010341_14950 [Streptomyces noursei]